MSEPRQSLLEFPCRFPIKIFGRHDTDMQATVLTLLGPHVPEITRDDLSERVSRGGRYIAITAHIQAQSQAQLDAIYTDLSASPQVLMSL